MTSPKTRFPILTLCILALSLLSTTVSHADAYTYEGPGWATPEEAVEAYLEGIKEQDLSKMIGAYAVETLVDHFDLQAQVTRLGMYSLSLVPSLPSASGLVRDLNVQSRVSEITRTTIYQMHALCLPGQDFTQPVTFGSEGREERIEVFVSDMDSAFSSVDFSTLQILRFIAPEDISELYMSERNQENIQSQIAPYGADEGRSVVVSFTVDGKVGALCCDAVRYGDLWYMLRGGGNIGAMIGLAAHNGGLIAMDLEELYALREDMSGEGLQMLDAFLGQLED